MTRNILAKTGHLEKCDGAILHFWAKIALFALVLAKSHFSALLGENRTFSHF